jgi:hypothetical protein
MLFWLLKYVYNDLVFGTVTAIFIAGGFGLPTSDFKQFAAAKFCWCALGLYLSGRVIMWLTSTSTEWITRLVVAFLAFGVIGVVCSEAVRAVTMRENAVDTEQQQQPQKPPPSTQQPPNTTQQGSSGPNSPNINQQGNNNQIIIYPPNAKAPDTKSPQGFHPAPPDVFGIALGGVTAEVTAEQLRKNKSVTPFHLFGVYPFTISLGKHGELLFSFVSWGNGVKVEVKNNAVKMNDPALDWNFSDNAFEIVDRDGQPIFQMTKTTNKVVVSGIFPTGHMSSRTGLESIMWVSSEGYEQSSSKPEGFALKPIFKYPSWKYKGQYAD